MSTGLGSAHTSLLAHSLMAFGLEPDRSLDELTEPLRQALVAHWLRRCQSEMRVGLGFAALAAEASGLAEPIVVQMLKQSAHQEREHARLCLTLAELYAGQALCEPETPRAPLPHFGAPTEQLELALQLTGLCCVNETLASAWLRHCLAIARAPFAVKANRLHLKDEIDHARLGWAHLASRAVTPADRAELAERLPELLRVNLAAWERDQNFLPGAALAAHGQPSAAASRQVLREAVTHVLLPGFAHVGIELARGPDTTLTSA